MYIYIHIYYIYIYICICYNTLRVLYQIYNHRARGLDTAFISCSLETETMNYTLVKKNRHQFNNMHNLLTSGCENWTLF